MKASDIPAKFPIPFGNSAPGTNIRSVPTTTGDPNAASLTLGFPTPTLTPLSAGGVPPDGRDFNGIINQETAWARWQGAGGAVGYDAAFSAALTPTPGYPQGAILTAAGAVGYFWMSLVDDNTSNPDTGGANWLSFSLQGTFTTGDWKGTFKTVADVGWVMMNDGSIGDATSGATTMASAVTLPLFTLLYNNLVDTWAPIQTSVGGATTRGAQGSAATAFGAHCRLVLPKALGRALCVAGSGAGLTARALGTVLGEETHLMTLAELVAHNHSVQPAAQSNARGPGPGDALGATGGSATTGNAGSSSPFNVMQPSSFSNVMLKL